MMLHRHFEQMKEAEKKEKEKFVSEIFPPEEKKEEEPPKKRGGRPKKT